MRSLPDTASCFIFFKSQNNILHIQTLLIEIPVSKGRYKSHAILRHPPPQGNRDNMGKEKKHVVRRILLGLALGLYILVAIRNSTVVQS